MNCPVKSDGYYIRRYSGIHGITVAVYVCIMCAIVFAMVKKSKSRWEVKIPNRVWHVPGEISKRPGSVYVCDASGPYLNPAKMPKHLNRASIRKWSAESNGKKHLKPV